MKTVSVIVAGIALPCLLFCACSQASQESAVAEDARSEKLSLSSSAAVEKPDDTIRKFIRTADIRFRVKNVEQATYRIEDIATSLGGFVTYTKLASQEAGRDIIPISADSSLETIKYTVVNNITLRVPNVRLDTTLKAIATLVDYLDYRAISADDVALQIKANKWAQKRALGSGGRLETALDKNGKLREAINGAEVLNGIKGQADEAALANLSLQDQVNFSTVSIDIYQRQDFKRWVIANDKDIAAYKPGLGTKLWDALKAGWSLIEYLIVAITHLWALILLAIIMYLLFRNRAKLRPGKA